MLPLNAVISERRSDGAARASSCASVDTVQRDRGGGRKRVAKKVWARASYKGFVTAHVARVVRDPERELTGVTTET